MLIVATAVGLLINVVQVLTSLQDTTVSTVPRLFAVAAAALAADALDDAPDHAFTVQLFSDFRPFLR